MKKQRDLPDKNRTMIEMPVVNTNAAGVDVGSRFHMVSVGLDIAKDVKSFGATTSDLHDLCRHLQSEGVKTVAVESTGYYWIPLYWMLQSYGFEVVVVNPAQIKSYSRPKTDVKDACWIYQLHSLGLLKPSFQVDNFGESLRAVSRRRATVISDRNRYINRIHKVLVLMNVQIGTQLTDLGGVSGMEIIRAIVGGQRDPLKLHALIRGRVKTSKQDLIKGLEGTWQPHYLFELRQLLESYDAASTQISACDTEIENLLDLWYQNNDATPPDFKTPPRPEEKRVLSGKNNPPLSVNRMLNEMIGVDLLSIGGVSSGTTLDIIAETGRDLAQFPSAKHFASWLGLAPNNKKSGGKLLSSKTPKRTNRAATAFKRIANAVGRSKEHQLKSFFHAIQRKTGWNGAVTATAHKLAVIYYNMVTKKEAFDYKIVQLDPERKRKNIISKMQKYIKELGIDQHELIFNIA